MLGDKKVYPTIPVTDLDEALSFYGEKLGMSEAKKDKYGGAFLKAGEGTGIYLYERGPSKADHTLAGFDVSDLEAEMGELRDKGIEFEEYDMPDMGLKTVNGIASMDDGRAAWFKDQDGNILALNEKS